MDLIDEKESVKIKKMVDRYNMIPNLFWSGLNLIPVSVFCYKYVPVSFFCIFLTASLLTVFIPNSFFNRIQLGKTTVVYKKIGVQFVNSFTQNGKIINGLIRKRFPHYKAVLKRRKSVDKLLKQTYMFEKFHFLMFVFFTLTTVYALLKSFLVWSLVIFVTNLLYNIYPNLLQQYLRVRLFSFNKTTSRQEQRSSNFRAPEN